MSAARNRRSITAQQLAMLNTQGLCSLRKSALLFGTALSVAAGFGYGRGAYAQTVNPTGALSTSNTSTLTITGPGTFETQDGFSVDTTGSGSGGNAITITTASGATGDTTFNDNYASSITGAEDGIYADNDGSGALSITTTGTVTGTAEDGIYANNSAAGTDLTIEANNVTGGHRGIFADNRGSGVLTITTDGSVTSGSNGGSHGIYANNSGGALTITANSLIESNRDAIHAENNDGRNDLTITVADIQSNHSGVVVLNGGYAVNGALVDRGEGTLRITAQGDINAGYDGINVTNYGADLYVSATNIISGYDGIYAYNRGPGVLQINATGEISANPSNYRGINAKTESGTSAGGMSITANQVTGYHGIYADNDGSGALSITANGAVSGQGGDGIYANNASTENLTITIAEGGSVSTSGTSSYAFAIEAAAPNGAVIVNNFGTVTGRVNLTNSNTFTNAGTWDLAGTTSNFNAQGNSLVVNEGLIIAASDGTAAEVSAINNIDTFRSDAGGTIRLADGAAGDGFAIEATNSGTGNFVANGGTVQLDVVLGGDGSAADQLGIRGDVILDEAPTALAINSVGGGTGGETTTGIEVVTVVDGTSDAGAFTLASPVEVGAFAYELSLGECADGSTENWYLCYTDQPGTTAAVFEAMPTMLLNAFVRTETLQQRLGARVSGNEADGVDQMLANATGFWMRAWGDYADITPDQSSSEAEWSADIWGLQTGIGQSLGRYAGGELVGGANIRYTASQNDLSTPFSSGRVDAEGHGVGLSMTWFDDSGLYADTNAGVDWVRTDARSAGGGTLLENYDDAIYSVSAEVGQRIVLDSGMTLVPQAQINWGQIDDSSLEDALGNAVVFEDRSRVTARLGLSVEKQVTDTQWGSGKVYGFGNVLHDLSGDQTVSYDGVELTQSSSGTWGEVGGGFSLTANGTIDFYGQLAVRQALDDVEGEAASFSAGVRFRF